MQVVWFECEIVFRLQKIRQYVVPTPPRIAELRPMIVVTRLAPHVDHAVDGGAAPKYLAARIVDCSSVQARFRLGLEAPIYLWVADAVEIADGNFGPDIVILSARLEQQNRDIRIC